MDITGNTQVDQYETIDNGLIVNAPAKINLSLLISGKREDGFHGIETIMAKIAWYDQIIIEHSQNPGIELICKGPCWAPQDDSNLVVKAARAIENHCKIKLALKITLVKNIPAGTGLGSASSDCAATLLGIDKLCNLNLSGTTIKKLGSSLGSDIPFFIGKSLAYCTGRGEIITEIDIKFPFVCLLITPDIKVSTVSVYKNYKHDKEEYSKLSKLIHPNIEKKNV
jgi:4-diphosphocytidyl-2-C-methyl-D-erythritol kinase